MQNYMRNLRVSVLLDEQHIMRMINKRNFPFRLGIFLYLLALGGMALLYLFSGTIDAVWLSSGAELLLYMIANAVCGLLVTKYPPYIKRTAISYGVNLVLLFAAIFLFAGKEATHYPEFMPIYAALLFCFLASNVLVLLLRKVISFLRD